MAEIRTPDISLTWIGNVLGGFALAFGIDNILMGGTVTEYMPGPIKFIVAFVVFIGATLYGYKQLKKLN